MSPLHLRQRLRAAICLLLAVGFGAVGAAAHPAHPAGVASADLPARPFAEAVPGGVLLHLPEGLEGDVAVHALAAWETEAEEANRVFEGTPIGSTVHLPRGAGGGDPMFRGFVVKAGGEAIAPAFYANRFDQLPRQTEPLVWPKSIKGVSNPVGGVTDLLDLGVKHVHINLQLNRLLLPENAPDPGPAFTRVVNGRTLRFDPGTVAEWDKKISGLSKAEINVVAVILNSLPGPGSNRDLLHPRTDVEKAPFDLGAFNLTNARGVAAYVGGLAYLAERYSDPASDRGTIGGYIIGNEVDSHWTWHNLGLAEPEEIIAQYAKEMRLAWIAIRSESAAAPVFVSLTHSWARPNSQALDKNMSGKVLMQGLQDASRAGGDYPWAVAFHPYPQNLFEPEFWNDQLAMFGYDTPMITFKNIELLPAWLGREENLVNGKPRKVILSEQGLHTPAGPDGERIQAAAYALAFHRISKIPGITAFILHRHVDVRGEGGLLLGVRGLRPLDGSAPYGHKKESWETFRVSGTPAFEREAAFALEHAGYASWSEAEPRPGPFPEESPEWATLEGPGDALVDLLKTIGDARFESALAVEQRMVGLLDGGLSQSLMLHPQAPSEPVATGAWSIELPDAPEAQLTFRTYLTKNTTGAQGDGVVYRVRVGDDLLFERTVTDHAMRDAEVDLAAYAGQRIELVLEVDPREEESYDTAQWLAPAVVAKPAAE